LQHVLQESVASEGFSKQTVKYFDHRAVARRLLTDELILERVVPQTSGA